MTEANVIEGQTQETETLHKNGSDGLSEATGKTITISGKNFNVSDDVAQALTDQYQSIDRRFDERAAELGELRNFRNTTLQREQELQEVSHKQEPVNLSNVLYEDTDKFVGIIEEKIAKNKEELRQEYQQVKTTEKAQTSFWNSMWAENEDLARVKSQATDVITMISQKYQAQYPNLQDTKEVRDAFANETRNWMKGLVGAGNGASDPDNFIEGSSGQRRTIAKKTEPESREGHTKRTLTKTRERKRAAMANPGLK